MIDLIALGPNAETLRVMESEVGSYYEALTLAETVRDTVKADTVTVYYNGRKWFVLTWNDQVNTFVGDGLA